MYAKCRRPSQIRVWSLTCTPLSITHDHSQLRGHNRIRVLSDGDDAHLEEEQLRGPEAKLELHHKKTLSLNSRRFHGAELTDFPRWRIEFRISDLICGNRRRFLVAELTGGGLSAEFLT